MELTNSLEVIAGGFFLNISDDTKGKSEVVTSAETMIASRHMK